MRRSANTRETADEAAAALLSGILQCKGTCFLKGLHIHGSIVGFVTTMDDKLELIGRYVMFTLKISGQSKVYKLCDRGRISA